MKYDCYKTLDLIHEYRRLCDFHSDGCENDCPFIGMGNCDLDFFDEDKIALLQKWSDEHPEDVPKLTRKERNFVASFCTLDVSIMRHSGIRLFVTQHPPVYSLADIRAIPIDPNMFPFIHDGEVWGLEKLLRLEVEE